MQFKNIFKSIRITMRLSQTQMALVIKTIPNTLKYWENGKGLPTANNMKKIEENIKDYAKLCDKTTKNTIEFLLIELSETYLKERVASKTTVKINVKQTHVKE